MGQQEIFNFLKKHRGEWFFAEDISKEINLSIGSVRSCLKKLRQNGFIFFRKINNKTFEYLYK